MAFFASLAQRFKTVEEFLKEHNGKVKNEVNFRNGHSNFRRCGGTQKDPPWWKSPPGPWFSPQNKRHWVFGLRSFGETHLLFSLRVLSKIACHNLKTLLQRVTRNATQMEEYKAEHRKRTFEQIAQKNAQEVWTWIEWFYKSIFFQDRGRGNLRVLLTLCARWKKNTDGKLFGDFEGLRVHGLQMGTRCRAVLGNSKCKVCGVENTRSTFPLKGTKGWGQKKPWVKRHAWGCHPRTGSGCSQAQEQMRFVFRNFLKKHSLVCVRSCGSYPAFSYHGEEIYVPTSFQNLF